LIDLSNSFSKDDDKERTEAEIEEFLNEKLRGEIQPEQVN